MANNNFDANDGIASATKNNWQSNCVNYAFVGEEYDQEQQTRRRKKMGVQQQRQQKQKSHRKRQHNDDEFDSELDENGPELLPKWKIFLVGAAIFLCFALLYPTVFAPLIGSLFRSKRDQPDANRNIHPSMTGPRGEPRPGRPMHPHPAAASLQQTQHGGGESRGGFAWLLPFYTVGVVCFLLYILFKKKKKRARNRNLAGWMDEEEDDDEDEDDSPTGYGGRGRKLRMVQNRLRKTEQAMQEILQQLEHIAVQVQPPQVVQRNEDPLGQNNIARGTEDVRMNPTDNEANQHEYFGTNKSRTEQRGQNDAAAFGANENVYEGMTMEQQIQMQKSLAELKMLSDMCKRDQRLRRRLRHGEESSDSDDEEREDGEQEEDILDEEEQDDELVAADVEIGEAEDDSSPDGTESEEQEEDGEERPIEEGRT